MVGIIESVGRIRRQVEFMTRSDQKMREFWSNSLRLFTTLRACHRSQVASQCVPDLYEDSSAGKYHDQGSQATIEHGDQWQ